MISLMRYLLAWRGRGDGMVRRGWVVRGIGAVPQGKVRLHLQSQMWALIMMTLRDVFALVAMNAYIKAVIGKLGVAPSASDAAQDAYRYADAMLEEREKHVRR